MDFQPSSSLILCSGGVDWLRLPLIEIARNSENTGWESGLEVHGIQLWLEGWRPLSVFWPLTLSGRRSRNSTTWLHFPGESQHRVTSRKLKGEQRGSYSRSVQAPSGMREHTTNLIHGLVLNAPHGNQRLADSSPGGEVRKVTWGRGFTASLVARVDASATSCRLLHPSPGGSFPYRRN